MKHRRRHSKKWKNHSKKIIKSKKVNKSLNFFDSKYQYNSTKRTFGLCDDEPPPSKPAYLDETDGKKWIAVVDNYYQRNVTFVALDHCIILKKSDGKPDRCSDGLLTYNSTIIFVELTTGTRKNWKKDKDEQLRITIKHFEDTKESDRYTIKKAYIANSNDRTFRPLYQTRMDNFLNDTGYDLRIENRIII